MTTAGAGAFMALSLWPTSLNALTKQDRKTHGFLRQYIKTPIINSHVHILPSMGYAPSKLIEEMDNTGQDIAIFHLMDSVPSNRTTLQYLEDGKSYCDQYPGKLIPFIGLYPGNPESLDLIDTAINDYGIVGFGEMIFSLWAKNKIGKRYGLSKEILPTDKKYCWPFYQKLQDLGVVALIDATQTDGGDGICYSCADHFKEIARAFSGLNFVIAGACITTDYTGENTEKCIELCQTYDNVYLDIHDWQVVEDKTGRFTEYGFKKRGGIRYLYRFLRRLFDHKKSRTKVFFGSDWPIANMTINMDELQWVKLIMENAEDSGCAFTVEEWEMFFGLNALGFLKKNKYFDISKYDCLKNG